MRVYRYFRANNTGYMVLHFEEGQSLKDWLKALGRAPRQNELDAILAPLLDALEMIHKADFLHRDIAPDNIIIRKSGDPVLIDFGSARGEIASHSKTVSALVKPGYSPYEQYAETSRQQGPWTDIYALGATLYHAVTGKRPPDAPSRMVKDEIVPAREAALSSYRAGLPQGDRQGAAAQHRSAAAVDRGLARRSAGARCRRAPAGCARGREKKSEESEVAAPDEVTARVGAADGAAAAGRSGAKGSMLDFLDGLRKTPVPDRTNPPNSLAPSSRCCRLRHRHPAACPAACSRRSAGTRSRAARPRKDAAGRSQDGAHGSAAAVAAKVKKKPAARSAIQPKDRALVERQASAAAAPACRMSRRRLGTHRIQAADRRRRRQRRRCVVGSLPERSRPRRGGAPQPDAVVQTPRPAVVTPIAEVEAHRGSDLRHGLHATTDAGS